MFSSVNSLLNHVPVHCIFYRLLLDSGLAAEWNIEYEEYVFGYDYHQYMITSAGYTIRNLFYKYVIPSTHDYIK